MRAQIGLGALLISACISDPAYIGEGPAQGDGVNGDEGVSDDGATGDEGIGLTGAGGGSDGREPGGGGSAATGLGGTTTGGAGGIGLRLPPESGTCLINREGLTPSFKYTWDAATRTLREGLAYNRYDERGLVVESADTTYRCLVEYDDRGSATSRTEFFDPEHEVENVARSFDQTNTYDPTGLLVSSKVVYRSGRTTTDNFFYTAGLLTTVELDETGPPSVRRYYTFVYENGRLVRLEKPDINGGRTNGARRSAYYDDAGRLIGVEDASGIDDVVSHRDRWTYDDQGRVVRYETDIYGDGEPLDGVPDLAYVYEPACADIFFDKTLYGMPPWAVVPYAQNGWRAPSCGLSYGLR